MFDAVDCHLQFQILEAFVVFYRAKSRLDRVRGCVGWEGFEHTVRACLFDLRHDIVQVLRSTGEQRDCKIAVRGMGQNSSNASTLVGSCSAHHCHSSNAVDIDLQY